LAALVKSLDDPILGKSLTGIIKSWNAGATRVFEYTAAEAIGKPSPFLAWPGEEGEIEALLQHRHNGERASNSRLHGNTSAGGRTKLNRYF
jgi:PAS domain S-box-containing protein